MSNTASHASETILSYLADTRAALDALPVDQIQSVVQEFHRAYRDGRQVLIIGNGGSAATASHLACDLAKTVIGRPLNREARRFRAVSLAENMSLVTAWGNDFSFDDVFAEQLANLGQPDDLLVIITASGNSPNIMAAVRVAKQLGMRSVGLLGFDGGRVRDLLDSYVLVRSDHYGHVEDLHMVLVHLMTAYFTSAVRSGAGA